MGLFEPRDSVQRIPRTWTVTAETDECLGSKRAATAALTRTVTGALLAPNRTQRTVGLKQLGYSPLLAWQKSYGPLTPAAKW